MAAQPDGDNEQAEMKNVAHKGIKRSLDQCLVKGEKKSAEHGGLRTPAGLCGVGVMDNLEGKKDQSCDDG